MATRAILTYHSLDDSGSPISVSPDAFAAHVRWLVSGRVRVVPLVTLADEARSGAATSDAVAITFDDGFANFADHAAPLLRAHDLPATVFVVSDHVGRTNAWGGREVPGIPTLPLMDWSAIGRVSAAGVEIGAHTRTHPPLDRRSGDALADEIQGGADEVTLHVGQRPHSFAYPYGAVSRAAAEVVRTHFQVGVTTRLRTLAADDDRALLPRLDAYYLRRPDGLSGWGTPRFRAYLRVRAAVRAVRERVR